VTYKAFVAATKKDLDRQRAYVIQQLRDAGLTVDPMENWPADADDPAVVSSRRTADCAFCIALVAFQRGSIAQKDSRRRSITEIEIDSAIRNGTRVLIFLLRDTPANRASWPSQFIENEGGDFYDWRAHLEKTMVCGYFDADTMPEVLPAVTRQIEQRERRRKQRYAGSLIAAAMALIVVILVFYVSGDFRSWLLARFLAFDDPVIFNNSKDGAYKLARLFYGRSDITDNTSFREEIRGTKVSFDLFANTFGSFRDYYSDFEELLRQGVLVRLIVTDFSQENYNNWNEFNRATEALPATEEETRANAANIRAMIMNLAKIYPHNMYLRLNRKPIFYTVWIRDPLLPSAVAHLGVTFYGQKSTWPAFRMSRRNGLAQMESLEEQFNILWRDAKPLDPQ
jgi:Domain of unknown function (DUF4062)